MIGRDLSLLEPLKRADSYETPAAAAALNRV